MSERVDPAEHGVITESCVWEKRWCILSGW